jgi:hypothetical protein
LPFSSLADDKILSTMAAAARDVGSVTVRVERISEQLQPDATLMRHLFASGIIPGHAVSVTAVDGGLQIDTGAQQTVLQNPAGEGIFVSIVTKVPVESLT